MRIGNEHISRLTGARIERVFRAQRQTAVGSTQNASADDAAFSTRSEDVRAGMAAARSAGSQNETRLAALRAQVRSGQYRPLAEAVAESMLRDMGK